MNIVVLLRRLRADTDGTPAPHLLGRCDDAALAAGLAVRAQVAGSLVTVIAAGPAERETTVLAHALGRGADRALRVYDPALASVDYLGIARVLGAAVKHVGFDLVLVGDRSEDEAQGAVGPAVAEMLNVTHVTAALDLTVREGGATHVVLTRRDRGHLRTLAVGLPGLITILRFPSGQKPGLTEGDGLAAQSAGADDDRIAVLDLAALGLQAPELKHRDRCLGRPSPVRVAHNATLVRDGAELCARLREDHLLPNPPTAARGPGSEP